MYKFIKFFRLFRPLIFLGLAVLIKFVLGADLQAMAQCWTAPPAGCTGGSCGGCASGGCGSAGCNGGCA